MASPGFTAESSLYATKIQYRMTGTVARAEVEAGIIPAADASAAFPTHGRTWAVDAVAHYSKARETGADRVVLPMGEPGHVSAPGLSSQCNDCTTTCEIAANAGFDFAAIGCVALTAIPVFGGIAYALCLGVSALVAYEVGRTCVSNCSNVGSPCCPIPCGPEPFCCFEGEQCLDSGPGLCCSADTRPCPGPQESCCYSYEDCLPTGACCAPGLICGDDCCGFGEACINGSCSTCTPELGGILCGDQCCDAYTQQCIDNNCCPNAQACADGTTCCTPPAICNTSGQCVVPQSCPPGEFLCVSADKTIQICCPGDSACCGIGVCCGGSASPAKPDSTCCGTPEECCTPPG